MPDENYTPSASTRILSQEQENLLDLYLKHLNEYLDNCKKTEEVQVEIETLHLKRILKK